MGRWVLAGSEQGLSPLVHSVSHHPSGLSYQRRQELSASGKAWGEEGRTETSEGVGMTNLK